MPGTQFKEYSVAVAQTAAGSATIAAAPAAGKKIVVTGFVLVGNGAGTVKFTSGSDLTGAMVIASGTQLTAGVTRLYGAEATVMTLTTATSFVNGFVNYIIAPA